LCDEAEQLLCDLGSGNERKKRRCFRKSVVRTRRKRS